VPGVLIIRPDAQLYYANALTVRDEVKKLYDVAKPPPKVLILDLTATDRLDLTSADILAKYAKSLEGKGIAFYLAEVHVTVLEDARTTGLLEVVGEDHVFATIEEAVNHVLAR
jgi:sulfate permease, SulP family